MLDVLDEQKDYLYRAATIYEETLERPTAAIDVYKIKYDSTLQAERVDKLRGEIRREQEAIATLRAEWAKLDRPDRVQELAKRHLTLRPVEVKQFDMLDKLPDKPIDIVPPNSTDPT